MATGPQCACLCVRRAHTQARKCALTHSGITFLPLNPWTAGRAQFPKCWKICSAKEHTFSGIVRVRWNAIHTTVADIIKWSHVCYTSAIESLSCAVHTAYAYRIVVVPPYLLPLVWCTLRMRIFIQILHPHHLHSSIIGGECTAFTKCILSATGHTSHIGIRIRRVAKSKENRICLLRANDANTTTMSNDDNLPLINSIHTTCLLCAHSIHIRFYRFVFKQL